MPSQTPIKIYMGYVAQDFNKDRYCFGHVGIWKADSQLREADIALYSGVRLMYDE